MAEGGSMTKARNTSTAMQALMAENERGTTTFAVSAEFQRGIRDGYAGLLRVQEVGQVPEHGAKRLAGAYKAGYDLARVEVGEHQRAEEMRLLDVSANQAVGS